MIAALLLLALWQRLLQLLLQPLQLPGVFMDCRHPPLAYWGVVDLC
jgi:hypothetical protein